MGQVKYNALKLSKYREYFHNKRVLVIGSGAVGSYLMEFLAKMGVSPDVMDYDKYTLENAAKHSCLVRTPEDADRNKAECTSSRVQELLEDGCTSNGIDVELSKLGPEAFADYEVVFLAVDNFDAKLLFNELVRQLPKERRPVVIMDGTYDEMAQSVILDNTDFCLDCLIDENWKKDSSIHTSCVGPQWRDLKGVPEIVRTSNMASSMAAHLSVEQFRAYIIQDKNVMNKRLTYTAYPNLELSVSHPMIKKSCAGCAIKPPLNMYKLTGTVLTKTLGEALTEISKTLKSDEFEVSVHRLNLGKVIYSGFAVRTICHSCGSPLVLMKHSGRMYQSDLFCESCKQKKMLSNSIYSGESGEILYAFTNDTAENIKKKTLFELGYPLGTHIEVVQRNGALSIIETEKIIKTIFYCEDDHDQMHRIKKL